MSIISSKQPNYLEIVNDTEDNADLNLNALLTKIADGKKQNKNSAAGQLNELINEPAFCVKTKDNDGRKVFINFCITENIEYPLLDLTEDELRALLQTNMADTMKIPMLLTELKESKDKSLKNIAFVIDVIINEEFYAKRIQSSLFYQNFLITVTLSTIESKYKQNLFHLDKENWIILKNRKYFKLISDNNNATDEDNLTKKSNTMISEIKTLNISSKSNLKSTKKTEITHHPDHDAKRSLGNYSKSAIGGGNDDENFSKHQLNLNIKKSKLTLKVKLNEVNNVSELNLQANEDKLILKNKNDDKTLLNLTMPFLMCVETLSAEFNLQMKQLMVNVNVNI